MMLHDFQITQVASHDTAGGAGRMAWQLHEKMLERGYAAELAVGKKLSDGRGIRQIPNNELRNPWSRFWYSVEAALANRGIRQLPGLVRGLGLLAEPQRARDRLLGFEDFHYPGTPTLLQPREELQTLIHLHNLHGGYFDLRVLPELSQQFPTAITLHDEWMFTGHCGYTLGCERWRSGCGSCPDLSIYPAINFDQTAENLERKKQIYDRSRLWVAAPSQWLLDRARDSTLQQGIAGSRVIRNGIDLNIFSPVEDKSNLRRKLGLPLDAWLLLFVGYQTKSHPFKDYATMAAAVSKLPQEVTGKEIYFLCLGEKGDPVRLGNTRTIFAGVVSSPEEVASYYQASDLYLHAAHADNYPTTILEAMACGIPVIATAVGGIPEQVQDQESGYLIPQSDSEAMFARIMDLLRDPQKLHSMGFEATQKAKHEFDLERMVDEYVSWYRYILEESNLIAD